MKRYLLSVCLSNDVTLDEVIDELESKCTIQNSFVLQDTCLLIDSTEPLAAINDILQKYDLCDYVLVQIASGKFSEGAPYKMYLYPPIDGINNIRNGE